MEQAFSWPVRVYWEDTDAGGIVFYANYLKFFERARTEWLRACGVQQQALRDQTGGLFVVSDVELKYHRPARLDDELLVTARITQWGRTSFTMAQEALLMSKPSPAQAGHLLCAGLVRVGWVDALTLKPARMPASVLEALKA